MATSARVEEPEPGVGVDSKGGAVVDPTRNVLDLVRAESEKRDELRDADKELFGIRIDALKDQIKLLSDGIVQYQNGMRDAETRRIDQLAQTRQEFQNTIRDMLAESVRTTSTLVSTQLVQIQATFDTRVSKLEAFQFTQAGRSSVADPQIASSLAALGDGITAMQKTFQTGIGDLREAGREGVGRNAGRDDAWKYATGAIIIALGIATFYIKQG